MKWIFRLLLAVLVLGLAIGGYGYIKVRSIDVEVVTDRVWMLTGMGGNVAVLKTGKGAVLVDSMTFKSQGKQLQKMASELTGEPVVMVINTHFHLDHSHGNPGFADSVDIVATTNTLGHMRENDPIKGYWDGAAAAGLPNRLVDGSEEITVGDQRVRLIHPGRGHTNGDLIAVFVDQGVLVTGDLVFHQHYPNIDLEHGGSISQWPAALDLMLQQPFEHVIPGHGPLTNADGVRQFQRFMQQLVAASEQAKKEKWSRAETIEKATLTEDAGYGVIAVPFLFRLDREFVLGRAWDEANPK